MRTRLNLLFVVVTYLALSAAPFIPLLFGRPVSSPFSVIGVQIVAWITVWAVFSRPKYFHWMLFPAFLLLPVEVYLQAYYNQSFSAHHLGIIVETSPREAFEFVGSKSWVVVVLFAGVLAWWLFCWRAALGTKQLDWKDDSRWVALALLSLALAMWLYEQQFGLKKSSDSGTSVMKTKESRSIRSAASATRASTFEMPRLPYWARLPVNADALAKSWPFGVIVRGSEFWRERQYLARLAEKSEKFRFGARQASSAALPQVVVMVIGESSRFDRWSLNGYDRETNPQLKMETNLVSLDDVVSAVSATRLSVPVLLSRKPARQSLQAGFSEKSFITAFKEAGFKTWWLSNQMSFGQFDTPVSVFAKEADIAQFLNLGGFSSNSALDEVLLAPLNAAISDPTPRKLIVLHTLGNHWNYSHRHSKEFDRWKPSLFDVANPVHTDLAIKERLNNSYDNSVLYTDWFLSQVIRSLRDANQIATMMYVSDHGQALYDGSCRLAFHGHNTQYDFHVPAFVWYSEEYAAAHPGKVRQLLFNRRQRLTTENVFHSLVDMGDIRYAGEQLEWSFVSTQFKRHTRYVDSYGWADYDNATFKGDCREVIDKGRPLLQD